MQTKINEQVNFMVYELNLKKAFIKKKNRTERTGNEGHEVAEARQLGVSAEDED